MLAIQETQTDSTNHSAVTTCLTEINKLSADKKSPKLTLSSTPLESTSFYKAGGTALLSAGPIASRRIKSGSDWLGRWSWQKFSGKNEATYTIVSCYQVNDKKIDTGSITNASQQVACLRQKGFIDPNPRKQFYLDLDLFLKEHIKTEKDELLLLGDFNECLYEHNSGMQKISSKFNLNDLTYNVCPSTEFATYSRGSKRIDYALGTKRFYEALIQGSYEPFGEHLHSDHRLCYLDFNTIILFGNETSDSATNTKKITYQDKTQGCKFLENLNELAHSRNLLQRSIDLYNNDEPNHILAEQIDKDMVQFTKTAQKRTITKHQTPWTLKMIKLKAKVMICQLLITMDRTKRNLRNQIEKFDNQYGPFPDKPTTTIEARIHLQKLKTEVKKLGKELVQQRRQEQNDKIMQLEGSSQIDDKQRAKIIRRIQKAETIKRIFRKIGRLRKVKYGGLVTLRVPKNPQDNPKSVANEPNKWMDIQETSDKINRLIQRNRTHFGQAEKEQTPMFQHPINHTIDYKATTIESEMILQGDYQPEDLDAITQQMLNGFKAKYQTRIHDRLTLTDVKGKYKCWNENTSVSPISGIHLGIWKTIFCDHLYSTETTAAGLPGPNKTKYDLIQTQLQTIWMNLINYALKWSYSYERWKNIVTRMIQKKAGDHRIHRLRVIHLYEADYNLICGVFWRKLLYQAEDNHLLNDCTYGGRPNRNAHMPPFMDNMMNEISRMSRKHLIKFDNDATSCYDRILISLGAIASRSFGMSKNVTMVWAKTLEEAKYKLKMNARVSDEYYQHCEAFPIHGSGQGSGNSPCLWLLISSVLCDQYNASAHGATFETPDKSITIQIYLVSFVDDTNGNVNSFTQDIQPPIQDLIRKMQHDAQLWHDLLWSSGGALELPKCFYQILHWDFLDGKPMLMCTRNTNLEVRDSNGETIQIKKQSPYSSRHTLGHFISTGTKDSTPKKKLADKIQEHIKFIHSQPLSTNEMWTYYFACYLPSVSFPLPNYWLSEQDMIEVQKKAMPTLLSKCGFNRNTKRDIVYGPWALGGANFRDLYVEQGIGTIKQVISYLRTDGQPTTLLEIAVAWAQYSAGTENNIFQNVQHPLPYLDSPYLQHLRTFLAATNAQIRMTNYGKLPLQRDNDKYIMQYAMDMKFTDIELTYIDRCRRYLQVLTIADITTPCGHFLDDDKALGTPTNFSSRSTLHHFNQERPPKRQWKPWHSLCALLTDSSGRLRDTLGPFHCKFSEIRSQWPVCYDPALSTLFTCREDTIDELTLHTHYRVQQVQSLSDIEQPVQPFYLSPKESLISTEPIQLRTPPPEPTSWRDYVQTLPQLDQDILYDFRNCYNPNIRQIWNTLTTEELIIATDGSVDNGKGTYGWIISTKQGRRIIKSSGRVYGFNPSSYRTELYAYLAVSKTLYHIKRFLQSTSTVKGKVRIDNEATVIILLEISNAQSQHHDQFLDLFEDAQNIEDNHTQHKQHLQALSPESDLIAIIHPLITNTSLLQADIRWIKAHQDNNKEYAELDLPAQLNCDADKLAERAHTKLARYNYDLIPLTPECPIHLDIKGKTITSKHQKQIRQGWKYDTLKDYVAERNDWNASTKNSVDWKLHGIALTPKINQKAHYCKLVHDLLPTNHFVSKWSPFRQPHCTRCGFDREDRDHIIRCPESDQWFTNFQSDLKKQLTNLSTDPVLTTILIQGIKAWRHHTPFPISQIPQEYRNLIHEQDRIGWRQIFNGRLTKQWRILQSEHHQDPHWGKQVISIIWTHWEALWKTRNQHQHGESPEDQSRIRGEIAKSELRAIYDNAHLYVPSDRQYLEEDYETHAAKPTYLIENWLQFYRSLFKKSIHEASKQATSCTISINKYFPTTHTSVQKHTLPQARKRDNKRRKTFISIKRSSTKRLNHYFTMTSANITRNSSHRERMVGAIT